MPDDIRDELAARTAREGRSLQEYLLGQLRDIAVSVSPSDIFGRARERARTSRTDVSSDDITAVIRDLRGE